VEKQIKPAMTVQNCTINNEAFKVDEHVASAIRAVADAAAANARALEMLANRLAGPVDNRIGIKLDNS
jgi:hypothetical protein